MHVEVNETNIAVFGLVQLTGNSREDLLDAAAKASVDGYVLSCQIPDVDSPIEVNTFEHFDSEKAPDVIDTINTYSDRCRYELSHGDIWVCLIHRYTSRHDVTGPESQVSCRFLDPFDGHEGS